LKVLSAQKEFSSVSGRIGGEEVMTKLFTVPTLIACGFITLAVELAKHQQTEIACISGALAIVLMKIEGVR
jgi:uncharacterized membrane protein SirB2